MFTGALNSGVKQSGLEVDHSYPPSAEFKSVWSYTSSPTISFHGMVFS